MPFIFVEIWHIMIMHTGSFFAEVQCLIVDILIIEFKMDYSGLPKFQMDYSGLPKFKMDYYGPVHSDNLFI